MAAEDIEKKVRKMSSQKPESGKDLQQLQEAQNQIVQINAERQGNLQMARLENNANAANNETMSQAVEMASLGGLGGAAVQQQVQAMNPQTQAVLGKYGLGQPRVQRSSSRNVQVTPQKITINNNTTNTTTNNVAVPAANIGGPVQGRTLAIKQDESQARFKTWISNAFAKQNQQAAVREKEYQRREWSLTRSTNKLMKHLSDLGKSVSERLNPQKLASSVGNQFKTILFLFGTTFLAKNWEKVIEYGAKIENFLFGARGEGINGDRGEPGFKKLIRETFSGENGLGSWLVQAFGGKKGEPLMSSIGGLIKDGFEYFWIKLKNHFTLAGEAIKKIEIPKLDLKDPLEALKGLTSYIGNIFSCLVTGGVDTIKNQFDQQIDRASKSGSKFYDKDMNRKNITIGKETVTDEAGVLINPGLFRGTSSGSYAKETDDLEDLSLHKTDINSNNELSGTIESSIRQSRALTGIIGSSKKGDIRQVEFLTGLHRLEKSIDKEGSVPIDISMLKSIGFSKEEIESMKTSKDLVPAYYTAGVQAKSKEELNRELVKDAWEEFKETPEAKALGGYTKAYVKDKTGIRTAESTLTGLIVGATIFGGACILTVLTGGGAAVLVPLLPAFAKTAIWSGILAGTGKYFIGDPLISGYIDWSKGAKKKSAKQLEKKYSLTEVSRKTAGTITYYKANKNVINRIKQKLYISDETDKEGNITKSAFDPRNSSSYTQSIGFLQNKYLDEDEDRTLEDEGITYDSSIKLPSVSINELEELRNKLKSEEEDWYNKSRLYSSKEHWSGVVNNIKNYRSKPSLTKDQGEFIRKMREAYSKRFKELGIDEKYIDALVAQDAIESGWGTSDLATKSNNFGGLKNGNKGWQKFNSLEDYINSKVDLLRNENGYYKNAFNGDDIDTMMNRVASVYDPKNNKYAGTWKDVYNSVSRYNPLSTEEIKSLRNQGKYAEADLASSSWEKIEDILRAGGVTDFIAGKTKREAGEAGNSGNNSYHTTENLALDIVPTDGNFERLKQQMLSSPLIQEYFKKRGLGVLDETTDEMLKKTGGTGYHFHIGPDRSSVDTWLAWNKEFNSNNSNEGGVYYADNYVEERKPESNYLSQLVLDEKSYNPEFSMPSFNSPFLASTSFTTPNSATKVPTIDTPMISAKTIGKEITSSNNDSATISDILKTTNLLNDNIKLLQQGQLAQVQATTSIASGLGNMTITINSGGDKKIPTAGWTKEPYA